MKSKKEEMKICRGAEYFYVAALSILAKSVTTFSSFLRFAFTKKYKERGTAETGNTVFQHGKKILFFLFLPFATG